MSALAAWALAPEELDFADSVAGLAEELRPAADALERAHVGADELLAAIAPQELAGAAVPEDLGGAGAAPRTALVAVAALAVVSPTLALLVAQSQGAALALARVAGQQMPDGCLAALVGGATIAVADARDVSIGDEAGVGDVVEVHGTALVDGARWADGVLLGAGTQGLLVHPLADAAVARRVRDRTGLRGLGSEWLELTGAQATVLPGEVARGALGYGAVATAVVSVTVAATALDEAAAYVEEREQFGRALATLPVVRELLCDGRERLAQAEARLALLAATDPSTWTPGDGVVRDAGGAAVEICDVALQLHGGYGYVDEFPAERRLRDALSLRAVS